MRIEKPLAIRIKSLNNQIKRLFERTAIEKNDANLTGMQYAILGFLSEQDDEQDIFQRDIEAEFNIRRSTASGMLRLLEERGYIYRETISGDARLKKIISTDKAKELDRIVKATMDELDGRLTKSIPPDELKQFYSILEKISDNAQE